jgi:hypothetical protein
MYVVAVYIFEIYVNFTTTKKEQRNADCICSVSLMLSIATANTSLIVLDLTLP